MPNLQDMQKIFPMVFPILTFNDKNLAGNLMNLAETLKISGHRRVQGDRFFQLQGPLALFRAWAPPSAKGMVRIVEGNSRAKALLNLVSR